MAEDDQVRLMREAGSAARVRLALRLSDDVIALSRRAIARSFPELDELGRGLKFVELHYGPVLADRMRAWLAARASR